MSIHVNETAVILCTIVRLITVVQRNPQSLFLGAGGDGLGHHLTEHQVDPKVWNALLVNKCETMPCSKLKFGGLM